MSRLTLILEGIPGSPDMVHLYPNIELTDAYTDVQNPDPDLPTVVLHQTPARVSLRLDGIAREDGADNWRYEFDLGHHPTLRAVLNEMVRSA